MPNEYSQVILNLLTNAEEAVKAKCVAGGIITIRVFERDEETYGVRLLLLPICGGGEGQVLNYHFLSDIGNLWGLTFCYFSE